MIMQMKSYYYLKKAIKKKELSSKKGDELEQNFLKLSGKISTLVDQGIIPITELFKIDRPMRSAFELLARCYHGKKSTNITTRSSNIMYKSSIIIKTSRRDNREYISPPLTFKNITKIFMGYQYVIKIKFLDHNLSQRYLFGRRITKTHGES